MNVYAYVNGNVVNLTDPLGLWGFQFGKRQMGSGDPWLAFDGDPVEGVKELGSIVGEGSRAVASGQVSGEEYYGWLQEGAVQTFVEKPANAYNATLDEYEGNRAAGMDGFTAGTYTFLSRAPGTSLAVAGTEASMGMDLTGSDIGRKQTKVESVSKILVTGGEAIVVFAGPQARAARLARAADKAQDAAAATRGGLRINRAAQTANAARSAAATERAAAQILATQTTAEGAALRRALSPLSRAARNAASVTTRLAAGRGAFAPGRGGRGLFGPLTGNLDKPISLRRSAALKAQYLDEVNSVAFRKRLIRYNRFAKKHGLTRVNRRRLIGALESDTAFRDVGLRFGRQGAWQRAGQGFRYRVQGSRLPFLRRSSAWHEMTHVGQYVGGAPETLMHELSVSFIMTPELYGTGGVLAGGALIWAGGNAAGAW